MGPTSCLSESVKKPTLKLLSVRQQWVSPHGPAHLAPRHSQRSPGLKHTPSIGPAPCACSQQWQWARALSDGHAELTWRVSVICRPGRSQNLSLHTSFRKTKEKLSTLCLMCFRTQKSHTSLRILPHEGSRSIEQMYPWEVYDTSESSRADRRYLSPTYSESEPEEVTTVRNAKSQHKTWRNRKK